ncbi:MAG: chemotaxis protein CheW [Bryobacteraceae bacterium]
MNHTGALRIVACVSGGVSYCLRIDVCHGVRRPEELVATPAVDGSIGWVGLEGRRVDVFNLADLLGQAARGACGAVMVLRRPKPWALAVEDVLGYLELPEDQIAWTDPALSDPMAAVVDLPSGPAMLLDETRLHPESPREEASPQPRPVLLPDPVTPARARRVVTFHAPGFSDPPVLFALSAAQVLEVSRSLTIAPAPFAPGPFLGFAKWRGRAIPVIDLARAFGLTSGDREEPLFVVARGASDAQALAIPAGPGIGKLNLPLRLGKPSEPLPVENRFALGVFTLEGQPLVVPDLDRMLARLRAGVRKPVHPDPSQTAPAPPRSIAAGQSF